MTDFPPAPPPPQSHTPPPTARWSQRQRYGFLEQRLYWEGAVSRADLTNRFGISAPQASEDLANYMELAPGNVEFDRSRKTFVATATFEPRFIVPSARYYLTQLLLLADDAIETGDSWLGVVPEHAAMPKVRRRLDPQTLKPIVMAISQQLAIEIRYQAMTSPEPIERWIAPHSLVYDGARWHARSWCYNRSTFSDFVLARMISIGGTRPSGVTSALDREWQETFTMELAPHPDLSETQRQAIEMDYGMIDGAVGIKMKLCMTQYFERHYGLDLRDEQLPHWRRQVVLRNRAELEHVRSSLGSGKEPA